MTDHQDHAASTQACDRPERWPNRTGSESISADVSCQNCVGFLCIMCGRDHVDEPTQWCDRCSAIANEENALDYRDETEDTEHDPAAGLSPDVAYGLAPAMAYELYHLFERTAEHHRPDGEDQDERLLLVRQAALADRCRLADPHNLDLGRAELLAWKLRSYDEKHGTTEGPVPAGDERWDRFPFGYVRQEYHQWCMYTPIPDPFEQNGQQA